MITTRGLDDFSFRDLVFQFFVCFFVVKVHDCYVYGGVDLAGADSNSSFWIQLPEFADFFGVGCVAFASVRLQFGIGYRYLAARADGNYA